MQEHDAFSTLTSGHLNAGDELVLFNIILIVAG